MDRLRRSLPGRSRADGLRHAERPSTIRRVLSLAGNAGKTTIKNPDDLLPLVGRQSWSDFEARILKFLCDQVLVEHTIKKSTWREELKNLMANMPTVFFDQLTTTQECVDLAAQYKKYSVEDTTGALAKRQQVLFTAETKADYAPDFGLDAPKLPTGYSLSVDKIYKAVGKQKDEKRPPWQKAPNIFSGKGETGIQNIQLSNDLIKDGLMRPNSAGGHDAVCVSCLMWTDVNLMDSDHAQSLSTIKQKLLNLAQAMTNDPTIYDALHLSATTANVIPPPVEKYFIVKGMGANRTFQLSQEGLSAYSHNMDNLIKMCKACNQGAGKHAGSLSGWLASNQVYGPDFAGSFPSGPGTNRVVDQTSTGQSASQAIYAHIKSGYGPAVEATYPAHEIKLFTHQTVITNARERLQAVTLPSPQKEKKTDELDLRDRRADFLVKGTKKLHQHFTSKLLPPMGSQSPQRESDELEDYLTDHEKKRSQKRNRETPEYPNYLKDASDGKPTDVTLIADHHQAEIAQLANLEGQRAFDDEKRSGVTDALSADLQVNVDASVQGRSLGYTTGYRETVAKRQQARDSGHNDGEAGNLLALPNDPDQVVANQLKTDYGSGYNAGMLAARSMTS